MTTEQKPRAFSLQRITQRKFAIPATSGALALVNDAAQLGFDFQTMVLVVAASLIYAAIEQWGDVARIRVQGGK